MKLHQKCFLELLPIITAFLLSIFTYPYLPDQIPSHWNMQGQVDGYLGKFWGVFLLPLILIGIYLLSKLPIKYDPLKANIEKFRNHYDNFILSILAFFLLIHVQIILWSFQIEISSNIVFPLGLSLVFYFIGNLLVHTEKNWTIGIRTPWTMSSDKVWEKTHKLGSKLFKLLALLSLIAIFLQSYAIYFIIIPTILVAIYLFVYSYLEFKKEKNNL